MSSEIKIEKNASEVYQPDSPDDARQVIRSKKDLSGAKLAGYSLNKLNASGAILRKTDLSGADLSHCVLVNPNFYRANLHTAAVHNTLFLGGDLVKTSFNNANLCDCLLIGVDAQQASFEGAVLHNASFISANLQDADFTGADLTNARLATSDVTGADFSDAIFNNTRTLKTNWSKAKVPPSTLLKPIIELSKWAWSVLIGGFLGGISLLIYAIVRKHRMRK